MSIRKITTVTDTILEEGGRPLAEPLTLCAAAAVIGNPWAGAFVEDLGPEVRALAPELALRLTERILHELDGRPVEAYGKGAIVGTNGEIEHGSAFLHTAFFGNLIRERLRSEQYISFADVRGAAGAQLTVPMADTVTSAQRSHFITHTFSIPDAPAADELVIAVVAASGGRPHARIGDRTSDPRVRLADYAELAESLGIPL